MADTDLLWRAEFARCGLEVLGLQPPPSDDAAALGMWRSLHPLDRHRALRLLAPTRPGHLVTSDTELPSFVEVIG